MFWWQERGRDLEEVIRRLNAAEDEPNSRVFATRACELYFDGLNNLWNAHARHEGEPGWTDTTAFVKLVQDLPCERTAILLKSDAFRELCHSTPGILDQFPLKDRSYRPEAVTCQELELDRPLSANQSGETPDASASLLEKITKLLLVVRSNIIGGEKAPDAADLEKLRFQEDVCKTVLPALILLVDLLLDRPSHKLVAYGTLRPGETNADVLENLRGSWLDCTVQGRLVKGGEFPFFTWDPCAGSVSAKLLISEELPGAWARLDSFEGSQYRRRLIPVRASGVLHIANVYEKGTGQAG